MPIDHLHGDIRQSMLNHLISHLRIEIDILFNKLFFYLFRNKFKLKKTSFLFCLITTEILILIKIITNYYCY